MAAIGKPDLQPTTAFDLTQDDCLVVCAGFEDRASAVLESALTRCPAFQAIVVAYAPLVLANRLDDLRRLCRDAGIVSREIVYDRMNPAGFGDALLREVGGVRGSLFLDVSAMSRLLIVQCLVALGARPRGVGNCVIAYAEASGYPPSRSEVEAAMDRAKADPFTSMLLLSSGVYDITVVPELSATAVGPSQTRLVAFPSFSPEQVTSLRNELSPSRCMFIHGVPPRQENQWRTVAIAELNHLALDSPDSVRASTLDYRQTLDILLELYARHSDRERLLVSPTGSKMQAVAVGLFRAVLDDVQVVYPTPKEFRAHDDYTRGVRRLYMLPLAAFASVGEPTQSPVPREDSIRLD
jgi:hypothetical protein